MGQLLSVAPLRLLDIPALDICSLLVLTYSRMSGHVSSALGLGLGAAGIRSLPSLCQRSLSKKEVPDIKRRAGGMLVGLCSLIWSSKCIDD